MISGLHCLTPPDGGGVCRPPVAQPYWYLDLVASLYKGHRPVLTGFEEKYYFDKSFNRYLCVFFKGFSFSADAKTTSL